MDVMGKEIKKGKNIVISNPRKVERLKEEFQKGGSDKIHILSDFDRTLTSAFINGEKVPSIISILRNNDKYLGSDYAQAAHQLYNQYHPIEINPKVSFTDKKKAMNEWWQAHFELIKKSGLKKKHLDDILNSGKIQFRKGGLEFFDLLHRHNIPLVIISSSGVGNYVITRRLQQENRLYPNIYIISNSFVWNSKGEIADIKQPIIHCLNKDETVLKNLPFYSKVKQRKNVLLLGDNIEDIAMVKGFDYQNLFKIGFLNENVDQQLNNYQQNYDIVALNDFSMQFVNKILKEVI